MSRTQRPPNAAQVRGDVDGGRSGAKAAGVDPAPAPMETDAKAGGARPSIADSEGARRDEGRHGESGRADPNPNAGNPTKSPNGAR